MAAPKYEATGIEAEFEPGSRGRVLRNLLGITRQREMNVAESQALDRYGPDHRFSAAGICTLHRLWLGPIYPWAGEYRSANIGKGGFQFAHAQLIPKLMEELERGPLARLLAMLMALQAGLPPLDFSPLARRGKRAYVAAIHAAVGRDYAPLTALFRKVIDRTRR